MTRPEGQKGPIQHVLVDLLFISLEGGPSDFRPIVRVSKGYVLHPLFEKKSLLVVDQL